MKFVNNRTKNVRGENISEEIKIQIGYVEDFYVSRLTNAMQYIQELEHELYRRDQKCKECNNESCPHHAAVSSGLSKVFS